MEKNLKKKNLQWVLLTAVFLVIFIIAFLRISEIFRKKYTDADMVHSLYNLEKNSVDVLVLGSSHAYDGISPNVLWKEQGISAYVLGSPGQSISTAYLLLKEALKYQNPKVVMLEGYGFKYDDYYTKESSLRTAFDGVKLNDVKIEMVETYLADASLAEKMTYYIPFSKYHSRWNSLTKKDFRTNKGSYLKGAWLTTKVVEFDTPPKLDTVPGELTDLAAEYMEKIVGLCSKNGIELMLFMTPVTAGDMEEYVKIQNMNASVEQYAKDKGIPCLNTQFNENISFDYSKDFVDEGHLNLFGQEKLSAYMAEYLTNHYDLPDHRGEEKYASWQADCEKWYQKIEAKKAKTDTEEELPEGAE